MNTAPPRYYLGLCAIARNETPFLREWVAYHHRIGFEKIYIYDNASAIPVRESLSDFYDLEACDTYTLQGEAMQNIAYNLCLRDHGPEFEWLAFFDLDEFLCLKRDTDARVLLRDYEAYSALTLHWDMFSSSGHITRPEGLVTLNYTQSLGYSCVSKCIVRPGRVKMTITSHHFDFNEGFAVNTNREPALRAYTPIATDKACLNHYSYRSQQDFAEKLEKADATYGLNNPRRWEYFYSQAGQPVEERADILPAARETQAMLENGRPGLKYDLTLESVRGLNLPQALAAMGKFLRLKQEGLAEVLFALCHRRFARSAEFVLFGVTLCLKLKKTERALELAHSLLEFAPDAQAYLALFECRLATGQEAEALRLGSYLLNAARFDHDNALQDGVHRLSRQYGFELSEKAAG